MTNILSGCSRRTAAPSNQPGATQLPYRALGSCSTKQGWKLLLPRALRAHHIMAGTMRDLHSLDCKTSAPGSLNSLNQQSNKQQSSNMENPFKKPSGKNQTKLLPNPVHGRTDHNQPPMWAWRANIRQISSYISANPPIHLLTHPSHVGLQGSSPHHCRVVVQA